MNSELSAPVVKIRKFNRFYTNLLGLLDQHLLDTKFSLTEARILYEIGESNICSAAELTQKLNIDPGYLSRILKNFEKKGIAVRVQSKEDGRLHPIHLTEKGKETLLQMNRLSDKQSEKLIGNLPDTKQRELVDSMELIQRYLSGEPMPLVQIRHDLKPGDAGALIHMHGWIYAKECGYNHVFEGYVCKTLFDFLTDYHPQKDRIWFAEVGDDMVGAIAIAGHPDRIAQLRWFLIHPKFRGQAIGKRLMTKALDFAKKAGYRKIYLETTDDQKTAIAMYRKAGFQKTNEREDATWGVCHMEQTYELDL
jgi:DNA-binding MarR family transcriptional regulator/GNAT superfamily N-acetyltransferase